MIPLLRRGRSLILLLLIVNGLGQAAATVGAAKSVEFAFSKLQSVGPVGASDIAMAAVGLAIATSVTAALRARERVDAERLGQSYSHDLRMHLFSHLTSMSPRAVGARSQGSTALRFIGDLSAIRRWVSLGLSRLCVATTMVIGTLVALALVNPVLAMATGAAAAAGGVGALIQGPGLRTATREARRRRSRLAGTVTETIAAVGVVQTSNAVERERRRVGKYSRRLRNAMIARARRLGRLQALAEATASGATAMLVLTALVFGIGAPQVAAAMTVVGLLVPQLRGLTRVQEHRQSRQVAVEAINRFLDRPPMLSEPVDPLTLPDGPGILELRSASFDAVREASAIARPGQTIAVVGPNGAGKSTLFSMIGRLVDLDGGQITLDGVDLARVPLVETRAVIGMAGPDLPLMKGSIRRNLTYQHRNAEESEIAAVIDRCDLADLVASSPDGLETAISERGANLSSGQRQRLLLARAALAKPRVLLLDEADANLDAATASVLDNVLADHRGTALIITHRLERAVRADEIWYLTDGRLAESGPPAELMSRDSATRRLFHQSERSTLNSNLEMAP